MDTPSPDCNQTEFTLEARKVLDITAVTNFEALSTVLISGNHWPIGLDNWTIDDGGQFHGPGEFKGQEVTAPFLRDSLKPIDSSGLGIFLNGYDLLSITATTQLLHDKC